MFFCFLILAIFALGFKVYKRLFYNNESKKTSLVWGEPEKNTDSCAIDTSKVIPIVMTIDDNYRYPALVAVTSLLKNANPETFYNIHFFVTPNFKEESKNIIRSVLFEFPGKCSIDFTNMKDCFINGSSATFPQTVYYRLRIPSTLSQCNRCIYLDPDILVLKDLTPLFNIDLKGNIIAAVRDSTSACNANDEEQKKQREAYRKSIDIPNLCNYVNSGVIVLDLEACRENEIENKFKAFLNTHADPAQHDQSVINSVCFGKILPLELKFNLMAFLYSGKPHGQDEEKMSCAYTEEEWQDAWENYYILHYAGEKPWLDPSVIFVEKWWNTARSTKYAEQITKEYRNKCNKQQKQ